MHDTKSLLMQCGRDIERAFGLAPKSFVRLDDHGWLGLTGEAASADLNMVAVCKGAEPAVVGDYVKTVGDLGLDAILIVDTDAPELIEAAGSLGLNAVGAVPVMVWEDLPAPKPSTTYAVRKATKADMGVVNELVATAFSLDEDMVNRVFPTTVLDVADFWLVEEGGEALGTGAFVPDGDHVGVYSMSTPERNQRRGVGRAVLDTGIAHYLDKGATSFTLEATEAGFHLYEQVGFVTAATPTVFVLGASTQFPG